MGLASSGDDGPGMPRSCGRKYSAIFHDKKKPQGTGMGLAVVARRDSCRRQALNSTAP